MREKNTLCSVLLARSDIPDERVEALISSLPFGEDEKARLRARKNILSLKNSLCSLLCLEKLMKARGLDRSFADMTIVRDERGKPRFESLPLFFSISHSRDICAVALSKKELGADVEFIDHERDTEGISKRFFSQDEQALLSESGDRGGSFFSLWTKKEALAKLSGIGLSALCSADVTELEKYYFKEFRLSDKKSPACLSICFERTAAEIEFEISNLAKELEIYEIPN